MLTRSTLRDLAKFGAGLVAADFLFGIWMLATGLIPYTFMGLVLTEQIALLWLLFDIALLMALVMYGWHIQDTHHNTSQKVFFHFAGILFGAIGLLHLTRIILQWNLTVGEWSIPLWMNALGVAVTLFLSYASFHFGMGKKK